jgi:hypothetical protein
LDDVAWEAEKARGGQRRKREKPRRREGRLALYARARKRERSAAIGAPTRVFVGRRTRLDSCRRRRHARVEKSCGGLKAAPARKSRVRDDAGTAYLHVGDAES